MAILLITALRAAETLAAFHRHRAENSIGESRSRHEDMVRLCAEEAEAIKRMILADGGTVENQAAAMRRRDITIAQMIIDRHVVMHGIGIPADEVPAARQAMAEDIADTLQAARGATS